MITVKNGNVAIEGALSELIIEAARIVDAIASTIEKKVDKKDINYNFVIEAILEYVSQISKVNYADNLWSTDEEIKFFQKAQNLRNDFGHEEGFVDYDGGTQEPTPGKNSYGKKLKNTTNISGGMKLVGDNDFFIDPRMSKDGLIDIVDIKKKKRR